MQGKVHTFCRGTRRFLEMLGAFLVVVAVDGRTERC